MFKRNEYQDLPMPARAQDIVTEARQRLAASGGKASDLPMMIEKVTAQYRQKDDRHLQGRDGHNAMQMPNNIDNYIDQVLGMSSMGGGGGGSAASGVQLPDSGPIPQGRDTSDLEPEQSAEADQIVEQGEQDGLSFGQILAGLAGVGGVYAAGRYLYNRYGSGDKSPVGDAADVVRNPNASAVDDSIDAVDGKGRSVVPYEEGMAGSPEPQQAQVADGKTGRLPPPPAQLTGPSAAAVEEPAPKQLPPPAASSVDQSIEATMDEGDIDEVMRSRVEGSVPQPSTQPRYEGGAGIGNARGNELDISSDEGRAIFIDKMSKLPPREAIKMMTEAGIELDEGMLRAIVEGSNTAKSLQGRASEIAGQAAKQLTRGAVR